ncbi:Hypothetical protein PFR_JS25-2_30 [Propionibacterium freudenreichii]|nr:Hypothetical protein PFR_JS25-2_30 [Propionibacterium freudenreichii]
MPQWVGDGAQSIELIEGMVICGLIELDAWAPVKVHTNIVHLNDSVAQLLTGGESYSGHLVLNRVCESLQPRSRAVEQITSRS